MPLPLLPPAPSRNDPTNFAALADAFLAALPGWTDAANALEQSLQLVATTGTSTTSVAIGTGAKAFSTQAGKAWVVGSYVCLVSAASIANRMVGQVTAYDVDTGALAVTVNSTAGAGTFAAWVIGLATSTATAAEISVADAGNKFAASSVETVLTEIFDSVRANSWLSADAGGSANAITATFTPTITALSHRQVVYVRAAAANTGTATFQADATAAKSIYKGANTALRQGDIAGAGHFIALRYDQTLDKWEMLNPAKGAGDDAPYPSDLKHTYQTADHGRWMLADGRTIGDAASGATGRANADTLALFTQLWNGIANADLPIQDSSGAASVRGASAAADFAAHKRLPLPDHRGMVTKGAPNGGGNTTNTARALGSYEADENKTHTHGISVPLAESGGTANAGGGNLNNSGAAANTAAQGNAEVTVRNRAANTFIYLG